MSSNVSKFASFRPKLKEPQRHEKVETSSKEKASNRRTFPSPDRSTREQESTKNRPYFSDRRGDPDALRYGTMNRYDIPPYRRFGYGFILGLSANQKIDRAESTDRKIVVTPATRRRQERLLTDKRANKSRGRTLRLVKKGEDETGLDQDFVLLSSHAKRKHDDSEDEDDEVEMEADYRRIDGPKSSEPVDLDTQYESDLEVAIDTEVTRKNSQLARQTKEHPEDVQGWLALIKHQEAMLTLERPSAELTASDKAHLADIRISTYEEALKKIGSDKNGQLRLYQGLLKEAERAWDGAKLASKWNDVLAKHPQSVDLWMMYLDFVQSRFTSFKYEECRATFFKCVDSLRATKTDVSPEQSLHLLLRITCMAHDAGYQELGLAVWQALLEHHLMRTEAGADIQAFEEFWESEVPRIGETGAKGWRHSSTEDALPPGPSSLQERKESDTNLEDFRKRECEAMSVLRYPGRVSDDVAEDDAFHTIFFSDIEPFLTIVTPETPATLIIEAFLCFCGLPPLAHRIPQQRTWWSDPFLQRHWHSARPDTDESNDYTKAIKRFSNYSTKSFQMTTELLFEQNFSLDGIRLDADFIRRLLKLLSSDPSSDDIIGEYLLAFESKHFPSEAFRTAKRLLKARPSSLRLYNAYGLVESRLGNSAKADQVFSMALSMQKGDNVLSAPWSLELFSNWVWEALRRADHEEALWRLVSPNGSLPSAEYRKSCPWGEPARLTLNRATEHALLNHDYPTAIICTSLTVLLHYLSNNNNNNNNLKPALYPYAYLSSWFSSHRLDTSPFEELRAQSLAHFLAYHATHAPIVKPSLIRDNLEPLINIFPANTILLSLYAANETRFAIDDRVRRLLEQSTLQPDERSVASWAFSIHYETLRGERAGATSHSIRALYKRAADSVMGMRCPALWRAWVHFELRCLHTEQARQRQQRHLNKSRRDGKKSTWETRIEEAEQRVKDTFYAGLRNLPWCKEYIMFAFTDAKDVFGDEEKGRLYRVMQEKELRLYVESDI